MNKSHRKSSFSDNLEMINEEESGKDNIEILQMSNNIELQIDKLWSKYDILGTNSLDKFEAQAFLKDILSQQ